MNSHDIREEFSELDTIEVVVEERRVVLDIGSPNHWRTISFKEGIASIPELLTPSFGHEDRAKENALPLLAKIREIYTARQKQKRFEAPYADFTMGDAKRGITVLRSVSIEMSYRARHKSHQVEKVH